MHIVSRTIPYASPDNNDDDGKNDNSDNRDLPTESSINIGCKRKAKHDDDNSSHGHIHSNNKNQQQQQQQQHQNSEQQLRKSTSNAKKCREKGSIKNDDDNNKNKIDNTSKACLSTTIASTTIYIEKWQAFFIVGLFLLGLATAALLAHAQHVRQQQKQPWQYDENSTITRSFTDDEYTNSDLYHPEKDIFDSSLVPNEADNFGTDTNDYNDVLPTCGPREWPELRGIHVHIARDAILESNPCVYVQILPYHATTQSVSHAYDPERVRLFMNQDTALVARTPRIG